MLISVLVGVLVFVTLMFMYVTIKEFDHLPFRNRTVVLVALIVSILTGVIVHLYE